MIEINRYAETHRHGVLDLILPIQQVEFGIPISLSDQPDLLEIPAFYRRGLGNFWVALAGGEVVGTIALLDIGNTEGALRKMFVKAPYRGAQHGVARRLLDALLAWCDVQRLERIYLGTTDKLRAAHRFYEKNGFRRVDRHELPAAFPLMPVDNMFYRLELVNGSG
jgi:GNAT superfamily N-acetyltransferase